MRRTRRKARLRSHWDTDDYIVHGSVMSVTTRARRSSAGDGRYVSANLAFSALTTLGGAKGEASPPIEAIWRTSVAVIGLTGEEAGRKTVRISGAIAPFMPAICIS